MYMTEQSNLKPDDQVGHIEGRRLWMTVFGWVTKTPTFDTDEEGADMVGQGRTLPIYTSWGGNVCKS